MNVWNVARQEALDLRKRLFPEKWETVPATLVIDTALKYAGLESHLMPSGDPLLAGGHAVLDLDSDNIWVRADIGFTAQNVLLAHELAHFYLHPEWVASGEYEGATEDDTDVAATLVGYGPRERRESEANVFARELCLPAATAQRLFQEGKTASAIGIAFGVSTALVHRQLQNMPLTARAKEAETVFPLSLDDSQRAAATIEHGPLLLGAGPGTGKTRTLVARVAFLLERDVAAENILCLTFSRKATAELRDRLARHLRPEIARRVAVSTFHAWGLDLLRRYHHEAGLPPRPVLLSGAEAFALMESRIAADVGNALWFPHEPTYPLRDVLHFIGRLKEEMVTPDAAMQRARTADDPKLIAVAAIYARYESTLREKNAIDSADLVCRAVRLLEENATVRRREQNRWQHLLVDEYQDINRAGARLVKALGGDGFGVWCVGDLRQAIYRFRGASPQNVTRFEEDFPGGVRRDLVVNYRSLPPLVSFFGQMATENAAFWTAARASETTNASVTLAKAVTESGQVAGITRTVRELHEKGYAWHDFAVLCRTQSQVKALRAALTVEDIPVQSAVRGMTWIRSRDVRELLLLMSLRTEAEAALAIRVGKELPETLSSPQNPAEFLFAALYGTYGFARMMSDRDAVQSLLELAQAFVEQRAVLVGENENVFAAFLRHVRRVARFGIDPKRTEEGEQDYAVSVLTVHAAKGLEFPVVFVPNLSQGRFPPRGRPSILSASDEQILLGTTPDEDAEEERLFFVAATRARDHLFFSLAERYGADDRMAKPSELLTPLGMIPEVQNVAWPDVPVPIATPEICPEDGPASPELPIPSYELERYMRCPRRYYFETRRGYGDTRERTGYDAFKKAVRNGLKTRSGDVLNAAWKEYNLSENDPWRGAYQSETQNALQNAQQEGRSAFVPPYLAELSEGTVAVNSDGTLPDGSVLRITFAKNKESGAQDAPNTLLFHAVPEGTPVRVCHVRTGEERVIEAATHHSTKKARANHLASYERALRGIKLNMFPAEPSDTEDCLTCAYLLICDGATEVPE